VSFISTPSGIILPGANGMKERLRPFFAVPVLFRSGFMGNSYADFAPINFRCRYPNRTECFGNSEASFAELTLPLEDNN
jgi:hypothetical protein